MRPPYLVGCDVVALQAAVGARGHWGVLPPGPYEIVNFDEACIGHGYRGYTASSVSCTVQPAWPATRSAHDRNDANALYMFELGRQICVGPPEPEPAARPECPFADYGLRVVERLVVNSVPIRILCFPLSQRGFVTSDMIVARNTA